MRRRTFMEMAGLGALGSIAGGALASGCAESVTAEATTDAGSAPAIDARPMGDTLVQVPDAANLTTDAGAGLYVVTNEFEVLLSDVSCSGHDHGCVVEPALYTDDTPVPFLGGSHLVLFRPSELVRLQNGEQIPFATSGPGPDHGHCGIAIRADLPPPTRDRMDSCHILPPTPATDPMAICLLRPSP